MEGPLGGFTNGRFSFLKRSNSDQCTLVSYGDLERSDLGPFSTMEGVTVLKGSSWEYCQFWRVFLS